MQASLNYASMRRGVYMPKYQYMHAVLMLSLTYYIETASSIAITNQYPTKPKNHSKFVHSITSCASDL
jgi:hypothetical protein